MLGPGRFHKDDDSRITCRPYIRECTRRDWEDFPSQKPAVDVLLQEEVPDGRIVRDEDEHELIRTLRPRKNGVKVLPARMRINSTPAKRIIRTLGDFDLTYTISTIRRPYKLLQWLEPKLRQRLSEIQSLCTKSLKSDLRAGDQQHLTQTDLEVQGEPKDDTVPPSSTEREESRDRDIFTSSCDWGSLTQHELQEAAQDLGVVVDFIDKYICPLREALERFEDIGIHYQELWQVFRPGTIVHVSDSTIPQKLWRVYRCTGGEVPLRQDIRESDEGLRPQAFKIKCYFLDFDGSQYIRQFEEFEIGLFEDLSSIQSLPIIPMNIAERIGLIDVQDCRGRGNDFISYTKLSYSYFRGQIIMVDPTGTPISRPESGSMDSEVALSGDTIESPVVVDYHRCLLKVPIWRPGRGSAESGRLYRELMISAFDTWNRIESDVHWERQFANQFLGDVGQSRDKKVYGQQPPRGDDILLLPNRLFAFILHLRRWACIPLRGDPSETHVLTKMEEDRQAWDLLQIDESHKTMIKSLMGTHLRKKKSEQRQFDIIPDKGKGLVILLHGVPGVGKTSTAEAVAIYYNKPLLPITCGDLGVTPTDVESNLKAAFHLAQAWECVLLLDEADVFLAERTYDNIERNALVSVFLRVLEYYEGILFLTTNRVGSFDEAFKSRMSMALYYPPLSYDQTKRIWEIQMDRTEQLSIESAPDDPSRHVRFNKDEIRALSAKIWTLQATRDDHKPPWNARQIRNVFQTAVALAEYHQQESSILTPIIVKSEHFEKVATISHEFNAYLYSVRHDRLDNELAHKKEYRFDEFNQNQFGFGGQGLGVPQQAGFQQSLAMPGGFQNLHQLGMMGMGMPHMGMAGSGFNNLHSQGNPLASQSSQAGFGNMNNIGMGMSNSNMGNAGLGHTGLGTVGLASAGVSGLNAALGAQRSNANDVDLSGQTLGGQMTPQQQQQLQELLRLQQQQQQ